MKFVSATDDARIDRFIVARRDGRTPRPRTADGGRREAGFEGARTVLATADMLSKRVRRSRRVRAVLRGRATSAPNERGEAVEADQSSERISAISLLALSLPLYARAAGYRALPPLAIPRSASAPSLPLVVAIGSR